MLMASNVLPQPISSTSDKFLQELDTARAALSDRVSELRATIQLRQEELTSELDILEREHRQRQSNYRDKLASISSIKSGIEEQFKQGEFEDLRKSILLDTDRSIRDLETEYPPYSLTMLWEGGLNEKIKTVGKFIVTVGTPAIEENNVPPMKRIKTEFDTTSELYASICPPPTIVVKPIDYTSRTNPILTIGHPNLKCELPQGIVYYSKHNSIFITEDQSSSLYKLCLDTNSVKAIQFPQCNMVGASSHNDILRVASYQYGVCIKNEPNNGDRVFISKRTRNEIPCDLVASYALFDNGFAPGLCAPSTCQHMYYVGGHGTVQGELNRPTGIAFDDPNLYVCDCKNNRINVYTGFCISRTILDPDLYYPLDVKVHNKRVYVLNSRPPYVIEFNINGFRRNTFLCNYIASDFVPCFFCIDASGRFLITDRRQPYVYVMKRDKSMRAAFETRLELEHGEERLVEPRGVCIDGEGRVVVVCHYRQAMIQIF